MNSHITLRSSCRLHRYAVPAQLSLVVSAIKDGVSIKYVEAC